MKSSHPSSSYDNHVSPHETAHDFVPATQATTASNILNNTSYQNHSLNTIRPDQMDPPEMVSDRRKSSAEPAVPVRTQAAFVSKLYKILEDTSIHHLISWTTNGDMFSVSNPAAFSKEVLPQYFKHNNWQSFVRQLNMYGFHKVNDIIHSNLTSENQKWEFRHEHFRRGATSALQNIKRKSAKSHHHYSPALMAAAVQPLAMSTASISLLTTTTSSSSASSIHAVIDPAGASPQDALDPSSSFQHMESKMYGLLQAYHLLKDETDHLKTTVSIQQTAIQELTDMLMVLTKDDFRLQSHARRVQQILGRYQSMPVPPATPQQHRPSHPPPSSINTLPLPSPLHPTLPPPSMQPRSPRSPGSMNNNSSPNANPMRISDVTDPLPSMSVGHSPRSTGLSSSSLGPPLTMYIDKYIPDPLSPSTNPHPHDVSRRDSHTKRPRLSH
ncbi:hypothetical protein DM01DRAFT_1411735 [Hesseltinella vesiculosa]|uniref:HSF-type DNA-binding domain-containing protein n=1 Tax=Hesseltinella vesiculosa TaxID=101127 RepID=A0A1X2G2K4_9FUNG|nr:hypothetical protein DM01DRAFT_1411735 [Hesseltinella vesiculosa]